MTDSSHASKCSEAIKAVSDHIRIKILELLSQNEMRVTDIVKALKLDQPKVSHHLAILRKSGVIINRRQGRNIIYSLNPGVCKKPRNDVDRIDFGFCSVEFTRRRVEVKRVEEAAESGVEAF